MDGLGTVPVDSTHGLCILVQYEIDPRTLKRSRVEKSPKILILSSRDQKCDPAEIVLGPSHFETQVAKVGFRATFGTPRIYSTHHDLQDPEI